MGDQYKLSIEELAKEGSLYPQEKLLKTRHGNKSMHIGVPHEVSLQENRVALTPAAVGILIGNDQQVCVEKSAGEYSNFDDHEYSESGAKIVYSRKEVFEADLVVKVEPPTLEEINLMKPGATILSAIQMGNTSADYFEALNKKKVTAIAFEMIEDKAKGLPIVNAMSELAGSMVVPIAAEYLSSANGGKGIILGGITGVPPTKVVILGAGTVGEYAARAALGLGADVRIFDNEIYKLRRIRRELGHKAHTSAIDTITLGQTLKSADVVIGAVRAEKGNARCVVSEEMVASMKPGSVIIDVSIDQGGCIATSKMTSHKSPIYKKYDVVHYCVPNIASRAARTATTALSNILTPILLRMAAEGGVEEMIFAHQWFNSGVYTYKGCVTKLNISKRFNLPYKDLSLLMAARF